MSIARVQLQDADYTPSTGAVRVRTGKGNRERLSYVSGMGCAAVEAWLRVRGGGEGPLFAPIHRTGRVQMRALREQSVYDMLARRATQACVPPFSPHDLRRRRPAGRRRRHQHRSEAAGALQRVHHPPR